MSDVRLAFKTPPIQEVSYTFQFEPLVDLHIGYIGLYWGEENRTAYPVIEYDEPLAHEIERFGSKSPLRKRPQFSISETIPVPRVRMISRDGRTLLQVQNDKLIFNWRRSLEDTCEYPRFDNLKKIFESELEKFEKFVAKYNLGAILYNQIMVINVNNIPSEGKNFSDVFCGFTCNELISDDLTEETFGVSLRHTINSGSEPVGRLYTTIQKTNMINDGAEVFHMQLLARAKPSASDKASAFDMLGQLRNQINLNFERLTQPSMHQQWGKETME